MAFPVTIVTVKCGGPGLVLPPGTSVITTFNGNNSRTPCQAYQFLLDSVPSDILVYCHDDVTVHDPDWVGRMVQVFESKPDCVAVGLGGGLGLGSKDLYRKPFDIWNLARRGYRSNQTDWRTHGELEEGSCRVAVLDAFCMAVRADWLRSVGGWPVVHLTHHCLDTWLACMAARWEKEIWMTGASCTHHGGGSSTTKGYSGAGWLQGGTLEQDHIRPHRWIFDTYRDILPIEVGR